MAKLTSLIAPGGAVNDTNGDFKLAVVLADKNYIWVESTTSIGRSFADSLIPAQGAKKAYADALLPAQAAKMGGAISETLASGKTGVSYAHVVGSTVAAVPDGLYLQKNGSYSPFHSVPAIVAAVVAPLEPTIGTASITAQTGDVVTIMWPITMAATGTAATSLTVDVFDALDTAFATALAPQQVITTAIGLSAVVNVSFANLDAMNGVTPRSFVVRAVAA
jgi:hypothetical protein